MQFYNTPWAVASVLSGWPEIWKIANMEIWGIDMWIDLSNKKRDEDI
jgi:hypothetical protein